ncbi:MAG: hypothetical protein AAF414_19465 [Pseudomonadota bacterium]
MTRDIVPVTALLAAAIAPSAIAQDDLSELPARGGYLRVVPALSEPSYV